MLGFVSPCCGCGCVFFGEGIESLPAKASFKQRQLRVPREKKFTLIHDCNHSFWNTNGGSSIGGGSTFSKEVLHRGLEFDLFPQKNSKQIKHHFEQNIVKPPVKQYTKYLTSIFCPEKIVEPWWPRHNCRYTLRSLFARLFVGSKNLVWKPRITVKRVAVSGSLNRW